MTENKNLQFIEKISEVFLQYKNLINAIDISIFQKFTKSHSSIGSHVRHIIDRANCLIIGARTSKVDYDNRKRNKDLEQNPNLCCLEFDKILHELEIIVTDYKKPILINETISFDGYKVEVSSTIEREFLDIIFHATHHLAIIKYILEKNNIKTESSFGKNAATIIYEKNLQ
jgi:hypothetical protein